MKGKELGYNLALYPLSEGGILPPDASTPFGSLGVCTAYAC